MPEVPVLQIGSAIALLTKDGAAGSDARPVDRAKADRTAHAAATLTQNTGRQDIVVTRRPSGRPRLQPPYAELGISLSYRAGLMLIGFAPDRAVGVDIETDDPAMVPDPAGLARDHYARAEADAVTALPEGTAHALFLRLWVAKEAALKVTGRGIADGLTLPDLSRQLTDLAQDGRPFKAEMGLTWPPVHIAVRKVVLPEGHDIYCALAVERL